jgi:putative holliday junction resolvase
MDANEKAQPATGKWLGIDYGDARMGIAVSDPMGIIARGLETLRWNGRDLNRVLERIACLVRELGICGLVIGIPRRTDGKVGESENKARSLAAALAEATGLQPVLLDERYTTVIASRLLRDAGQKPSRRRDVIDQVAAEIILQEYLESRRQAD